MKEGRDVDGGLEGTCGCGCKSDLDMGVKKWAVDMGAKVIFKWGCRGDGDAVVI